MKKDDVCCHVTCFIRCFDVVGWWEVWADGKTLCHLSSKVSLPEQMEEENEAELAKQVLIKMEVVDGGGWTI